MQNETRHAPATAMNRMYGMRDSEVIMRVSNAWNKEIESEREREREEMHAEEETMDSALKEPNGEHARSSIEFVLEHGASCCTAAFTNKISRLRSFMYNRMHIKYLLCYTRVYKMNKARCVVKGGEEGRVRRGVFGVIHSWTQGCDELIMG